MENDGDVSHGYVNPITRQPTRFEKLTLSYVSCLERTLVGSIVFSLAILFITIFPFQEPIQTILLIWWSGLTIIGSATGLIQSK